MVHQIHKPQEKLDIPPTKTPILTQQITTDFQLCQETWNQLTSQMNAMAKTNKLLRKTLKSTHKRWMNVQKNPKKA